MSHVKVGAGFTGLALGTGLKLDLSALQHMLDNGTKSPPSTCTCSSLGLGLGLGLGSDSVANGGESAGL